MKRIITGCIAAAIALVSGLVADAQNRSIQFAPEGITVEEMFAQAKAQGKTIFIDCYTSWCGPCKMMARDVFTNDDVADYFNKNFFNVKFDMEKGEGLKLNKKFGVSAYPTMLFIDSGNQCLVHTVIGARKPQELIKEAEKALNPEYSMDRLKAAYEGGDKTPETVGSYLKVLGKARLTGLMDEVAQDYLKGMGKKKLAEPENWEIFSDGVRDLYSAPAQLVFKNRKFFTEKIGSQPVDWKLASLIAIEAYPFTNSKAVGPDADFDQAAFDKLSAFLRKCDDPCVPAILLPMRATKANQDGDQKAILECLRENLEKKVLSPQAGQFFVASNVARLGQATDPEIRKETLKFMDDAFEAATTDMERAGMMRMKGIILRFYGDAAASEEAMAKSMEYGRRNAANYRK